MPAKFITFEGGEGAGKTTQVRLLMQSFKQSGLSVVTTREPGGTKGAELIRDLLVNGPTDKWQAKTELLLHLAARSEHIDNLIKPSISSGSSVICDRFSDSTIAYQAYGHGLGKNYVSIISNMVLANFQPDLTIFLDIDISKGIKRTNNRSNNENRYEQMERNFHQEVKRGFLENMANAPKRCAIINAMDTIENIHKEIIDITNTRLGLCLLPS